MDKAALLDRNDIGSDRRRMDARHRARLRLAIATSLVTGVTLACFAYAFLVADRDAIFLYYHLGATSTSPITRSRYWMTGLVASGVVLGAYLLPALIWRGRCPAWRRVWAWSALPVAVGIWVITVLLGRPPIAAIDAALAMAATWAGLALAVWSATALATQPCRTLAAFVAGVPLAPFLTAAHAVELVGVAPSLTPALAWSMAVGSVLAAWIGVAVLVWLYRKLGIPSPSPRAILLGSLTVAYVLLPLVHFVLATPPAYKYITAADNFLARSWLLQAGIIALAWGIISSAAWIAGVGAGRAPRPPG